MASSGKDLFTYQTPSRNRQGGFKRSLPIPVPTAGTSASSNFAGQSSTYLNTNRSRGAGPALTATLDMLGPSSSLSTVPSLSRRSLAPSLSSKTSGRKRMSLNEKAFHSRSTVGDYNNDYENTEPSYFGNTAFALTSPDPQYTAMQSGRKDLSNYPPCQKFKLEHPGNRIHSVGNEITGETVIAVTSTKHVIIYSIKPKDKDDGLQNNVTSSSNERFQLTKIHQLQFNLEEMAGFCLSSLVSVTLPPLKLMYALNLKMSSSIYFYNQQKRDHIPSNMCIDDTCVTEGDERIYLLQKLRNPYPVMKMALDGEKEYLACVLSNSTVVVWDLSTRAKFVTFSLSSHGVHIEWHKSEPYKLMVVEARGCIKFFNVYKQSCFMSINAGRAPLYSADWAKSNSLMTSIGWSGGLTIINCSQLNSNFYKTFEIPQVNVSKVKFNPSDDMVLATLVRSPGIIRLWRQNFSSHIWSHKNKADDIAWMHGQPYLIALAYRSLYFYEASVL